ncbi:MAG: putative Fimbral protein [Candidatus Saccharibacteria bacterium]|nr:putative Fimbral protein [Candidatus Saccharibacteria bacterium]
MGGVVNLIEVKDWKKLTLFGKMRGMRSNNLSSIQRGFTIVELLIVIVVIGILASVTIVAYNGVTKRAQDIKTLSLVRTWEQQLSSYAVLKGEYPYVSQVGASTVYGGPFCLGKLPADGNFSDGECVKNADLVYNESYYSPQLVSEKFTVPNSTITTVTLAGGRQYRGIYVDTYDDKKTNYSIIYPLVQQNCQSGDSVGFQNTADGSSITGAAAPGTFGIPKICVHPLPNL